MDSLMLSNLRDYQAILENGFEQFLLAQEASDKTRKNYRSDIRQFLNWLISTIQSRNIEAPKTKEALLKLVNSDFLENYKSSQTLEHTPASTINRRLSAIRMFFRCALRNGWTYDDPAVQISNISRPTENSPYSDVMREALGAYRRYKEQSHASDQIDQEFIDIQEFFEWFNQPNQT